MQVKVKATEKKCLHCEIAVHTKEKLGITNGQDPPSLSVWCFPLGHPGFRPSSSSSHAKKEASPWTIREAELTSSPPGVTTHIILKATAFHHSCSWLWHCSCHEMLPGGAYHLSLHFLQSTTFPLRLRITNHTLQSLCLPGWLQTRWLTSILTHSASAEGAINFIFICL